MTVDYAEFLASKLHASPPTGIEHPDFDQTHVSPHQIDLTAWSLIRGRAAVFADAGLGKQAPLTEPVLTPSGWRTMGDLEPGDQVIGSDGKPTTVLGVFPQGVRRVFRIELSDGSFSRCGDQHLWAVRTNVDKYRGNGFRVLSAKEIGVSIHRKWQIPVVAPVEHVRKRLPLEPYALGVLLGDGALSCRQIETCTDNWIGETLSWRKTRDHESCDYVGYYAPPRETVQTLSSLELRGLKSSEKFVPTEYMHASSDQRLALLQGLMDTDGYAMPDGGAEFSSTSRNMFDSLCELVRSLGGVARGMREAASVFTHNGEKRKGQQAWRVNVKLPHGVSMFRLPRKAADYIQPTKYPPARIIRRVVDEGVDEPQVCIMVDAHDGLYVTRDHVVTHNTRIEVLWANAIHEHTQGNVLIFAPLAVASQSIAEAERIGLKMRYVRSQDDVKPGISITNYDRLDGFRLCEFAGVGLDESSILKSFNGATKQALCEQAQSVPFRLAATATPAPNDHDELLNHAEFLGVMPRNEALSQFFYHDGGDTSKWTLKRHARDAFWRWVCSWAALVKLPSDLGYSDEGYILPPLNRIAHVIPATQDHARSQGLLFAEAARTLNEQRRVRRGTLSERSEIALDLVASKPADPWVIWCELNDESRELARVIPGAVEVHGSQKLEDKERLLREFSDGRIRVLVTKPKIAGMGMNWQHCADIVFVGASHSHEQTYQALRRCWRFGQRREVNAHFIYSELEGRIMENLARKETEADEMAQEMRGWTREIVRANLQHRRVQAHDLYEPTVPMTIPDWLQSVGEERR